MDTQTVKQEEQVVVIAEPRHDGRLWESFPEPRGWAMRWDGFALSGSAQRNGHDASYPIVPEGR
ncbi:MAG TPA: hypothetical protein PLH19_13205 [Anaerolineae bacterium]|nr:hypothetical protein [Anaerolineae bacterium]HQH39476.1 hypothetical protein [Anaerolineae bacterium]